MTYIHIYPEIELTIEKILDEAARMAKLYPNLTNPHVHGSCLNWDENGHRCFVSLLFYRMTGVSLDKLGFTEQAYIGRITLPEPAKVLKEQNISISIQAAGLLSRLQGQADNYKLDSKQNIILTPWGELADYIETERHRFGL